MPKKIKQPNVPFYLVYFHHHNKKKMTNLGLINALGYHSTVTPCLGLCSLIVIEWPSAITCFCNQTRAWYLYSEHLKYSLICPSPNNGTSITYQGKHRWGFTLSLEGKSIYLWAHIHIILAGLVTHHITCKRLSPFHYYSHVKQKKEEKKTQWLRVWSVHVMDRHFNNFQVWIKACKNMLSDVDYFMIYCGARVSLSVGLLKIN